MQKDWEAEVLVGTGEGADVTRSTGEVVTL